MSRLLGIPVIAFSLIFTGMFWELAADFPKDAMHDDHAIIFVEIGFLLIAGCAGLAGFAFGLYLLVKGVPE